MLTFQRMDGVAENFHTEQNRELLEQLASQTGGRYWRPAGSVRACRTRLPTPRPASPRARRRSCGTCPSSFCWLVLLRSTEWLLRRKWGIV